NYRPRAARQRLAASADFGDRLWTSGTADRLHGRGWHCRCLQRQQCPRGTLHASAVGRTQGRRRRQIVTGSYQTAAPASSSPSSAWERTATKLCFVGTATRRKGCFSRKRPLAKQSFVACIPKQSLGTRGRRRRQIVTSVSIFPFGKARIARTPRNFFTRRSR